MLKRFIIAGLVLLGNQLTANACGDMELPPYHDEYVYYMYQVTDINGEEVWAEGNQFIGDLYFTKNYLVNGDVKGGDFVIGVFDAHNTEDGLLAVEVLR